MKVNVEKLPGNRLVAWDDVAIDEFNKFKTGDVFEIEFKRGRNPQFHGKAFSFLQFVYHHYQDPNEHLGQTKAFDVFRKSLTVLSGYYDTYTDYNGETRLEAKSLSYASMSQSDFEEFYKSAISAAMKYVFQNTDDENLYNQLMSYF